MGMAAHARMPCRGRIDLALPQPPQIGPARRRLLRLVEALQCGPEQFGIRRGSGGAGKWRGGDGSVRRIRFLEPMTASILSNGRHHGAFGMAGGQPGAVGINKVVRSDGRVELLDHIGQVQMQPGDVFEIHTPGGGGFGVV